MQAIECAKYELQVIYSTTQGTNICTDSKLFYAGLAQACPNCIIDFGVVISGYHHLRGGGGETFTHFIRELNDSLAGHVLSLQFQYTYYQL